MPLRRAGIVTLRWLRLLTLIMVGFAPASGSAQALYERFIRAVTIDQSDDVVALLARGIDPNTVDPNGDPVLVIADRRFGRRLRSFDVPRDPAGDLAARVLEHAEDGARVGPRRAQEREAVLLRFRERELVRHHDALLGAVKTQRAVDPAPSHPRLADRELVVVHVDRRRGVLFHHAPEAPGGEVRRSARVGVAVRLGELDPNEVVRTLPVEAVAFLGADDVVGRAQQLPEGFRLLAIAQGAERSDVGHLRILRHASDDNSAGDTPSARGRRRQRRKGARRSAEEHRHRRGRPAQRYGGGGRSRAFARSRHRRRARHDRQRSASASRA